MGQKIWSSIHIILVKTHGTCTILVQLCHVTMMAQLPEEAVRFNTTGNMVKQRDFTQL